MATSNSTSYRTVYGTSSNDSIYNSSSAHHVSIYAGAGSDTVKNYGDTVSIAGGAGSDFIYSYSYYSTIDGDGGNDIISLNSNGHHNVIRYYSGEGNDLIYNLGSTDSIRIYNAQYTRSTVGNDVVLGVGSGSITVKDARYKTVNVIGTIKSSGGGGNNRSNTTSYRTVYGTSSNDSIYNSSSAHHVSIYAGAGSDTVKNYGDTVSIAGGAGSDFIYSYSYYSTIDGDSGNDIVSLNSNGHHNVIRYYSGEGNDIVYNLGSTDSIRIYNAQYTRSTVGNDVVLGVGSGSITVKDARYKTVNVIGTIKSSGGGGYSKSNTTSYRTVYGTSSNDSIYNSSSAHHVTISAGSGNDTIRNLGDTVSVAGGSGNDVIYSYSYYSTLEGNYGNDRISLNSNGHHNFIKYNVGDGNDTVYNLGSTDSIRIYNAQYTRSTVGNDVVLGVGSGSITVKDARYKTVNVIGTIKSSGGGGNNKSNTTSYRTVYGTSSNDSIYNSSAGHHVSIYAGAGSDTVKNYGDTVSIAGGAGSDFIYSYSYYSTIDGDSGNDIVSLNSNGHHNVIRYYSGEGNDIVYNLGSTDTVSIVGGYYSRSTVGNDVVLRVGSGSITVKNARYRTVNVRSSYSYYNVTDDWISADDNNFTTSANLSSIVDSGAANYSVAELDSGLTSLTKKNNLITYSGTAKK